MWARPHRARRDTPGILDGVSNPHVAMDQDPANPDRHVTQALQGVFVIVCDVLSSSDPSTIGCVCDCVRFLVF